MGMLLKAGFQTDSVRAFAHPRLLHETHPCPPMYRVGILTLSGCTVS